MQDNPKIRYNSYEHLLKIVINISLSLFNYGFSNGYFNSISFKDISTIFGIEGQSLSAMQGILTGCLSFTGGIGAFWSSALISRYSRNECLQILCIFMILISFLLLIPNLVILLIARCLQGFCIGMITAIGPIYIREISPTELASSLCPYNQIGMVVGLTFSFTLTFLLSLFLQPETYWWIVFGFPIVSSLIQLYNLRYKYPYETPKWLMLNQKQQQAKQLLRVIYKEEYVNQVYEEIKKGLNESQNKQTRQSEEVQMEDLSKKLIPKKIQLKTNPLAMFASFHLAVAQQMIGIGVIIAYSGEMIGQILPSFEKVFPIFISFIAVFGGFLSIPILKAFGRKKTLEYGALSIAVFLFTISLCFFKTTFAEFSQSSWLMKFLICLSMLCIRLVFGFANGPVTWIYMSETIQPNIMPYAAMINWISVAIVNTIFPILRQALNGNPAWIFMVFGLYTFLSFLISKVVLIETQNKTQYQIMKQYDEKWNKFKLT